MMIEGKARVAARGRVVVLGLLVAALTAAMLLAAGRPAHAVSTFTVNSTADLEDEISSDGLCDTGRFVLGAGPECTLRAAIQQANAASGADTIKFGIPGTGVKTIAPTSGLPFTTETVTINGYSQPEARPNTARRGTNAVLKIELSGINAGDVDGLFLGNSSTSGRDSSGSVVKGLVINRFQRNGIFVGASTNVRVEGNFLGTDSSGETDLGNGFSGVSFSGGANTVGGLSPEARNLISGNGFFGVDLGGIGASKAQGNLIGTDKDGTSDLGNDDSGVRVLCNNCTVGGTDNDPNDANNPANTVAFNGEDGVEVRNGINNRILSNSIFSNGEQGIDVGFDDGPTANDPLDQDTGPNNLQNKPTLTSAKSSASATTIRGRLNSTPGTTFKIQFFSNPSGENEGRKFLGQTNVTTGSDGLVTFTFSPSQKVVVGQTITATATDPGGNTSEFSAPREVVAQ